MAAIWIAKKIVNFNLGLRFFNAKAKYICTAAWKKICWNNNVGSCLYGVYFSFLCLSSRQIHGFGHPANAATVDTLV